jgi:hypothetical protein
MSGNSRPSSGTAGATSDGPLTRPSTASRSVGPPGQTGFARSDFFATMVPADAHLAAGDLEQGCATALRALTAGELIRSGRCGHYLREFRQHLTRAADATVVTDFHEQARGSRLWLIASRPDKAAL